MEIDFSANLVVMCTQGLDAILGMNWLHRNQATVSYDKRTINLVSPSGKEVVIELFMPYLEEGACHHLSIDGKEANLLEDIRIVSEFLDVFPEELPGVGGMLHRRRSCKKKHLWQILSKAVSKLSSIKLQHSGMSQDEGVNRLKDEMTNRPVIACIMIVSICKGHECNFSQATSCAYK